MSDANESRSGGEDTGLKGAGVRTVSAGMGGFGGAGGEPLMWEVRFLMWDVQPLMWDAPLGR